MAAVNNPNAPGYTSPQPAHVPIEELGPLVPLMSNAPSQWIAAKGMMLRVLVGSGVHGMAIGGVDDRDEMGICVEPPWTVIGGSRFEHYEYRTQPDGVCSGPGDLDLVVYSLRKFVKLATQGNPTVLLPLFVPDDAVLYCNDFGTEMREQRAMFLSRQAGPRFRGYLESQRRGLMGLRSGGSRNQGRKDYRDKYGFDVKFAAHMIRLGIQGIELLETGNITLPIPEPHLSYLRGLKSGEFLEGHEPGSPAWVYLSDGKKEETLKLALTLEAKIDRLMREKVGPLPDAPDRQMIDDWVVSVHRRFWKW